MDSNLPRVPPGYHPFEADKQFYGAIGPLFAKYSEGRLNFGFRAEDKHANAAGIIHGGMLFTVMDIQVGLAAAIELKLRGFVITINMTSDFMAPGMLGQWVESESRVIKQTRRLIFSDGLIRANGASILRANAVLKVNKNENFDINDYLPPEFVAAD